MMDNFCLTQFSPKLFNKERFVTIALFLSTLCISSESRSELFTDDDSLLVRATQPTQFPLLPGITATGLAGDQIIGQLDAMIPLYGTPTQFLYVNPQGALQNGDNYSGALGLGYRWFTDQAGILGTYLFMDYNHSPDGNGFWFVSPGFERLGDSVDFSANLYVPVSTQQESTGVFQGTEIGENAFVSFQGHNQYDALFETSESVGIGGDMEVGYRLPMLYNPKFYLGGYYFAPQGAEENILGGSVRLEVPLTENIRVSLSDAYDNSSNNTFKVGLSVDMGGRHTEKNYGVTKKKRYKTYYPENYNYAAASKDYYGANGHRYNLAQKERLITRMLDPIHRNLVLITGPSVTYQPISQNAAKVEDSALVKTHISFFEPEGTNLTSLQDGTFENPYQGLNQTNVDNANTMANTNFYFNAGTYTQNDTIYFTNDNLYGRQPFNGLAFALPASNTNRPIFDFSSMSAVSPAFDLTANTNIAIDGLSLLGNTHSTGLFVTANSSTPIDIAVSNIEIENFGNGLEAQNLDQMGSFSLTHANLSNNSDNGLLFTNYGNIDELTLSSSVFMDNGENGISIDNAVDADLLNLLLTNVIVNENDAHGVLLTNAGTNTHTTIEHSQFNDNTQHGIFADNQGEITYLSIQNVMADRSGADGFHLDNTGNIDDATLSQIELNNNQNGIAVHNIAGGNIERFTVSNTSASNNTQQGLALTNSNANMGTVSMDHNSFNGNAIHGAYLTNHNNASIDTLTVTNTEFNGNTQNGLSIDNTGVGSQVGDVSIAASDFSDNGASGIFVNNDSTLNTLEITTLSNVSNNGNHGIFVDNSGGTLGSVAIAGHTSVSDNAGAGIHANNTTGQMTSLAVNDSSISGNLGNGVTLINTQGTLTGNATFSNTAINDNAGNGIAIDNQNLGNLSTISITQSSTIHGNGSGGLNINNNAGNMNLVLINQLSEISNNNGNGIFISNRGGTVTNGILLSSVNINENLGNGLSIDNSNAGILSKITIDNGTSISENTLAGLLVNNAQSVSGAGFMGNITLDNALVNQNHDGVLVDNTLGRISNVTVTNNAMLNNNEQQGFRFTNTGGITNSITFNNMTSTGNNSPDIFINNSGGGAILSPLNQVTVSGSTVTSKGCSNCTFVP